MSIEKRLKKIRGFTIIEALLAFVVIALGALAIATLLNRSLELNADGEARTEALHLAKATIADFRHYTTKAEAIAYTTDATGNTVFGDHATYTRTWTVGNVTGNTNSILLTVDVAWIGVDGAENVKLTSQIAKLTPEEPGTYLIKDAVSTTTTGTGTVTSVSLTSTSVTTATSSTTQDTSTTTVSTTATTTATTTTTSNSPILYNCTCTWAQTNNRCDNPPTVVSAPSGGSCCASPCAALKPSGNQACKNSAQTETHSCTNSP